MRYGVMTMHLDERKFDPDQPRDEELPPGEYTDKQAEKALSEQKAWLAERRAAEAPQGPASGLIFRDYDGNAPAAAPIVSGDPALDQALSVYTETIGEFVGEQCGQTRDEVQAAVAPLQEA